MCALMENHGETWDSPKPHPQKRRRYLNRRCLPLIYNGKLVLIYSICSGERIVMYLTNSEAAARLTMKNPQLMALGYARESFSRLSG